MVKRRTIVELLNEKGWINSFPKDRWLLRFVPLLEHSDFRDMNQETFIEAVKKNYKKSWDCIKAISKPGPYFLLTKILIKVIHPDADFSQFYKCYFIDQSSP